MSVGLSSGCVELRHTQEKIPRFLRRREETIVQVDEKKEARCDYSHAPPWGITSHSRQCAGSNRPRFCFGKDGSLKIVAWLRIIPNEPATISESDATCLHARRVSLSFSLPRHFRRLFSCYTSRAWLRMYNVSRHPQHTHARTRVVLVRRKFQISRAADKRGLGGGRGEQREDILGVQCAHVSGKGLGGKRKKLRAYKSRPTLSVGSVGRESNRWSLKTTPQEPRRDRNTSSGFGREGTRAEVPVSLRSKPGEEGRKLISSRYRVYGWRKHSTAKIHLCEFYEDIDGKLG